MAYLAYIYTIKYLVLSSLATSPMIKRAIHGFSPRLLWRLDHQSIAVAGTYDGQPGTGCKLCTAHGCN